MRAYVGFVATEQPATLPPGWLSWSDVLGRGEVHGRAKRHSSASDVGAQDALHVGHHGQANKGALRSDDQNRDRLALLAELGLQFGNEVHITTGPMYHSGPLAFASHEIDRLWQQGVKWLEAAGAKIKPVSLPHTKYALPVLLYRRAGGGLLEPGEL